MPASSQSKTGYFIPAASSSLSIPYRIEKSRRKTAVLSLQDDLTLLLKVPLSVSYADARQMMCEKERWILRKYTQMRNAQASAPQSGLTDVQRKALEGRYRQAAREYFAARVAYYEKIIGVTHGAIAIRDQKTRWGSCSAKGNLNFNWRLMLAPPRILDYVVVHELCHRKEMNHSKAFWNAVEMVLPDYKELRKWLKQYGTTLTL